ncbi:MAG: O-methyltransferase [Chloroflexota bacterium]
MDGVTLREYADSLFGGEDPLLSTMRREAEEQGIPTIQIPTDLARLLALLITVRGATRVLEVGTLFGYSSISMARALPPGGSIVTLEINESHAEAARRNFQRAGVADKVSVTVGPALQSLENLREQRFDFVFIDADKDSYPVYLDAVLGITAPGSVIVADNVWRSGSVLQTGADPSTQALAAFNKQLAAKTNLLSTVVPTRNGEDAAIVAVVRETNG